MQTMITTLTVRVPIGIESMSRLAEITAAMKEAYDTVLPEKDDGNNPSVTLTQTVDGHASPVAGSAPRRRGPNKAKPPTVSQSNGSAAPHLGNVTADGSPKDTSKPGTETTQPAWKVQAGTDGNNLKTPPFLDRTAA